MSLRTPLATPSAPRLPPPDDRPALRLAVSRGLLGIELDAPFALGPLRVLELALGFPQVRFPVDLSGGVPRFRHKRGALSHVALEVGSDAIARWAAPRLRGLFAESAPEVAVAPLPSGLFVGLRANEVALAFEVLVAPLDGDLRFLPERARGIGLGAPPEAVALRALAAVLAPHGRVARGAVVVEAAAAKLGRHLLPLAGARAPSAEGLRWHAPRTTGDEAGEGAPRLALEGSIDAPPPALEPRVLRALELTDLAGDADLAAYAGDLDAARRLYLAALERAPRHPEIAERLAWIDALAGGRAEAALSTLIEAMPAASAGVLGGVLLEAVGDVDGARVAFTRAAHAETFGPLAGLTWLEVARLASEGAGPLGPALDERLDALDHAVARAPSLESARWARLVARLDVADLRGARGDAEHLEAAARGADAKLAVWRRAAEAFLARGHVVEAGGLFERALRYAPDDAHAVTGLARALKAAGQGARAVDLFARAVALAERRNVPAHDASIELARALAEAAGDRPAAIARVRAVPAGLAETAEARFLEGKWRAEMGDVAGAGVAFGRLRDALELAMPASDRAAPHASMLDEAAAIEERERGDLHAAQRDLGLALRLRPRDPGLAARFRRVAGLVARPVPVPVPAPVEPAAPPTEVPPAPEHDEADDERLVDELTARVRASPRDHAAAMQLAGVLARLGRDLDLLALLSARLDEGDESERREVAPMRREVLLRLAHDARASGRASEADLYEAMASAD